MVVCLPYLAQRHGPAAPSCSVSLPSPITPGQHYPSLASRPLPRSFRCPALSRCTLEPPTLVTPQADSVAKIMALTKGTVIDGMKGLLKGIDLPDELSAKDLYRKFLVHRNCVTTAKKEHRSRLANCVRVPT